MSGVESDYANLRILRDPSEVYSTPNLTAALVEEVVDLSDAKSRVPLTP